MESAQIKADFKQVKRGWGSIPVCVSTGTSSWNTSIFPSKEGYYLLPIKASIRKKEHIDTQTPIAISIQIGGRVSI